MVSVAPGISLGATGPLPYEMWYPGSGTVPYREPFCLIRFDPLYVHAAGFAVDLVMNEALKSLVKLGPPGVVASILVKYGLHWYGKAQLEADGALLVRLAQHFCGARLNGVDLTAWPVPGLDPDHWQKQLVKLREAARPRKGARADSVPEPDLTIAASGRTELGVPVEQAGDKRARAALVAAVGELSPEELEAQREWIAGEPDGATGLRDARAILAEAAER